MSVGERLVVINRHIRAGVVLDVDHFAVHNFFLISITYIRTIGYFLIILLCDLACDFFFNRSVRHAALARGQVDCLDADAQTYKVAVHVHVYGKRGFELQINVHREIEIKRFEHFCDVHVAGRTVGSESRDETDNDVLHDKHADLAVCDGKDDLHLFIRAHIRCVPCRLSVAGA